MHASPQRIATFLRFSWLAALTLALTACGGGGGFSNPVGGIGQQCDPGTQVQLANPQPGQAGVPGNIGQIVIVANGNNNLLFNSFGQWSLILSNGNIGQIESGQLNLVSDPNGPHPFASDFYYAASISNLVQGENWSVSLVDNAQNCLSDPLNSFST